MRDYLNERFPNDKLLKLLVKYHSIIKSVATPKRQIEKCRLKDEIRNTNRNLLDGPERKERPENWWKEKVGCRFHQIRVQI